MRKIYALAMLLLVSVSFSVSAMELTFSPNISAGFRSGKESLNDEPVAYGGVKFFLLKHDIDGFKQLNFLGPGLNFQSDGKFALSVSPVSVSSYTGMTIGLDYFVKDDDVKGGNLGLFVGFTFN